MVVLALLALVASVMVWASPSSQAQSNEVPIADAGDDDTLNPGAAVDLDGTGSIDVDGTGGAGAGIDDARCNGCEFKWEIETGPYDWVEIANDDNADTATFDVPSEAYVDKVADSDPHKYEIVVRLTVTDDDGATDSDTVSININQRPVADIGVYAGLRDKDIADADLGPRGHFPVDAVIDGPGENGNRDNEWDVMEGAWLQLDGSGSTDENPGTGKPGSYQWTRVRPTAALDGYVESQTNASATGQRLVVPDGNAETITFAGVDADDNGSDDTLSVPRLPNVEPNAPQVVFYQLTVCDGRADPSGPVTGNITAQDGCTNGRTGAALVRIVVHDTSATPEVEIEAGLTTASKARGDAAPQSTVSQFTGVENQFIVAAGSTVVLTAAAADDDQPAGTAHSFRWSGATPGAVTEGPADDDATTNPAPGHTSGTATVRVPADADDGDAIDVSVTVTDRTRISVTTPIQLLVGENTVPTAGGVPANMGSIDNPQSQAAVIYVHKVTDGFQSPRDGSTVTLRGVGNDADGDAITTAWALREGPDHAALNTAIGTWITAIEDIDPPTADNAAARATARATASGAALGTVGAALQDMQEPDKPLFELNGALTDTVSFDVPNLENGKDKGTILLFSVIDSNGVPAFQIVYVYVSADNDAPNAKAGDDEQVDPEAFVRLNGSASSDPDVGDEVEHRWEYTGATMDPAPNKRSPLSADEVNELDGWILDKADNGSWEYIVDRNGQLIGSSDNLKSPTSPYPYFDAPDLTGFNNLKLNFRLAVFDKAAARDVDGDGATTTANVASLSEVTLDRDLDGDGDKTDPDVTTIDEAVFGWDLNNNLMIDSALDISTATVNEAMIRAFDSDTVTVTVVNRYYSGNISGPDHCTGLSLGGPQTSAFDSDGDGVADTCSLNTTRRATVARQNALETLANLNPTEFRNAVNAECGKPGFKQGNYGDDPADLDGDVCETGRVTPPPAAADPATADEFFSGTVSGPDYCTNHSLGGARTYAFDSDSDGVADVCSLPTTRREAIARQTALESFMVAFTAKDQTGLTERERLVELEDDTSISAGSDEETERNELRAKYGDDRDDDGAAPLTTSERAAVDASIEALSAKKANATRYNNALAAACRALGSQDFGDAASSLARDECVTDPTTGRPLN
ncbi:MAG: hypothetical protein OXG50_05735 [bacterium]|nr:hypothetical protein [bacterium]